MHDRPHADDAVARFLREEYGPPVILPEEDAGDGIIRIGRRGGIYDAHGGERGEERDCETTLVARYLGITERPELRALLTHVLAVDAYGHQKGMFRFGRLVERMWFVYPQESWRIEHWARLLVRAAVLYESGKTRAIQVPASEIIACIRHAWDGASRGFGADVRAAIEPRIAELDEHSAIMPFGLLYSAIVLWKMFAKREPAVRRIWSKFEVSRVRLARQWLVAWLEDAMRAELIWQLLFVQARQDVERASADGRLLMGDIVIRGVPVRVATVTSSEIRIHSALMAEFPDLFALAVRDWSTGNVRILRRNFRRPVKQSLQFVVAQVRAAERALRREPAASWDELVSQMGPAGTRWFYQHATQNILNGALTEKVEPTELDDAMIQRCLVRGLDESWWEWRAAFLREHGGRTRRDQAEAEALRGSGETIE
ncbi:hypothetical protein C4552_00500 [Candidatus Parcubacteria bacterium]|nr:MAG: hypothetical protein C4552_00500 [Candidatus Parcubacteria bacterium]